MVAHFTGTYCAVFIILIYLWTQQQKKSSSKWHFFSISIHKGSPGQLQPVCIIREKLKKTGNMTTLKIVLTYSWAFIVIHLCTMNHRTGKNKEHVRWNHSKQTFWLLKMFKVALILMLERLFVQSKNVLTEPMHKKTVKQLRTTVLRNFTWTIITIQLTLTTV